MKNASIETKEFLHVLDSVNDCRIANERHFEFVWQYADSAVDASEKLRWLAWGAGCRCAMASKMCACATLEVLNKNPQVLVRRIKRLQLSRMLRTLRHRIKNRESRVYLDLALVSIGCRISGKALARDYRYAKQFTWLTLLYELYRVNTRWAHATLLNIAKAPGERRLGAAIYLAFAGSKTGLEIAFEEVQKPGLNQRSMFAVGLALLFARDSRGPDLIDLAMAVSSDAGDRRAIEMYCRRFRDRMMRKHPEILSKVEGWLSQTDVPPAGKQGI